MSALAPQSLANVRPPGERRFAPLRILVAFDGSADSRDALGEAVRIARGANARLTIASVVARTPAWAFAGRFAVPFTPDDLRRACEREAEAEIARAREYVPDAIPLTTRILRGRTSSALVDEARAGGYDLVVAGSRPGRLLRRRDVANALVHRCPVSVLVVRGA